MTQHLDSSLLAIPVVALEASLRALDRITQRLFTTYADMLAGKRPENLQQTLAQSREALDRCFDFVSRIPPPGNDDFVARRIAQLHAIDHLLRFRERLIELDQVQAELANPVYGEAMAQNRHILALASEGMTRRDSDWLERMAADAAALAALSRRIRHGVLQDTGPDSAARALQVTDTFRRLERAGNHVWRVCHYMAAAAPENPPPESPPPEDDPSEEPSSALSPAAPADDADTAGDPLTGSPPNTRPGNPAQT
jgi:phosphate:Na+ symporter